MRRPIVIVVLALLGALLSSGVALGTHQGEGDRVSGRFTTAGAEWVVWSW